jgi:quercetin dioxygenase-like cupin family protein
MSDLNRRTLCLALPALATALAAEAHAAPVSENALASDFSQCKAFPFEKMPLRFSDGGAPTHDIVRGTVPTGELIELHETTIAPGKMPHPAHQHPHEEFILIREGTVDFMYNGESHLLGPGSVGYTAPNQMHGFKNVGTTPATYFIFSLSKK